MHCTTFRRSASLSASRGGEEELKALARAKRRSKENSDEPPPTPGTPEDPLAALEWSKHAGAHVLDPRTGSRVWTRGGKAALCLCGDGAVLARHEDGTEIRTSPDGSHVVVEAPGLGAVEVDAGIDATATHHALGLPVHIKVGCVNSVQVTIPWSKLGSKPVVGQLEGVYRVAAPLASSISTSGRRRAGAARLVGQPVPLLGTF